VSKNRTLNYELLRCIGKWDIEGTRHVSRTLILELRSMTFSLNSNWFKLVSSRAVPYNDIIEQRNFTVYSEPFPFHADPEGLELG
jgi:hypothetical protein